MTQLTKSLVNREMRQSLVFTDNRMEHLVFNEKYKHISTSK